MPSFEHLILLSLIGIFGGVANLWLANLINFLKFSNSKVSSVSFCNNFWIFYLGIPTIKTLVGALLVIISTLIIFRREIYNKKLLLLKQSMTKVQNTGIKLKSVI